MLRVAQSRQGMGCRLLLTYCAESRRRGRLSADLQVLGKES